MDKNVFSVTQLTQFLKGLLREEEILQDLWVAGEISNFYRHSSGHCYFTLKDARATLKGVLFRSQAREVPFALDNGLDVLARGTIDIYESRGEYQLYIQEMEPAGVGALHLAFQQLKERLEKEGLFQDEYKKAIPRFPKTIGVVTSPTGAAIRDILSVLQRRHSGIHVLIAPSRVQGEEAGREIVKALASLQEEKVDVIILTRGGGSIEEMWPFNEEIVARSIYDSSIPVISAVGHERDFTISDFVADYRAPTPSAAAEIVSQPRAQIQEQLQGLEQRLKRSMDGTVQARTLELRRLIESRVLQNPEEIVERRSERLDDLERRITEQIRYRVELQEERFATMMARLEGVSPLNTLARGYCVCQDPQSHKVYKKAEELTPGDLVEMVFMKGRAQAFVKDLTIDGSS